MGAGRDCFGIHDGFRLIRTCADAMGPSRYEHKAMHVLPAIARDTIPKDGDRPSFTVLVRNEGSLTRYPATLTFADLWMGEVDPPRSDGSD
ncbi:hypothetical protein [Methylobacterium frigidaeris]|uniref:Uncharacterized protein n=1 Tax=Methylobacterium frigidaeris TaxID=2038277 RepID=A0AA37HH10_9HYPH|nr:hypothetical protein [Methylobacterium frigidaeris]GJD65389.1 hypothetical protein MPEAHAMD_5577 [Methylobacterium frigidaeris]